MYANLEINVLWFLLQVCEWQSQKYILLFYQSGKENPTKKTTKPH